MGVLRCYREKRTGLAIRVHVAAVAMVLPFRLRQLRFNGTRTHNAVAGKANGIEGTVGVVPVAEGCRRGLAHENSVSSGSFRMSLIAQIVPKHEKGRSVLEACSYRSV